MSKTLLPLADVLGHEASDKRIDILRRIGQVGSISEAARGAGVSYKAAWQALETLTNLAGIPLVDKAVGGTGGGGAVLTAAGQQVLQAAQAMAEARRQVLDQLATASNAPGRAVLALRTSMRNQFPCTVTAITKKAGFVRVALTAKGGTVFHSKITSASAELFELHPGQQVLVLCKATAVQIQTSTREKNKNVIHGIVVRKSRGSASGEVNLLVEPGITIVGFVEQLSQFNISDEAKAVIDETAVVLALGS
jgi:molybdate transport system regulatory protein